MKFLDREVAKCGLCRHPVKRRDAVSVWKNDPSDRVVEFVPNLSPRLMTVHGACHERARIAKHEHRIGRPLSEEERLGLVEIERVLGPVEVEGGIMAGKAKTKGKAKGGDESFKGSYDPSKEPKTGDLPPFATSKDKADLAESGEKLSVYAMRLGESKHGAVFHLDAKIKGWDGPRTFTFSYDGKVARRDHLLEEAIEWLGAHPKKTIPMRIVKSGRTYILELV